MRRHLARFARFAHFDISPYNFLLNFLASSITNKKKNKIKQINLTKCQQSTSGLGGCFDERVVKCVMAAGTRWSDGCASADL